MLGTAFDDRTLETSMVVVEGHGQVHRVFLVLQVHRIYQVLRDHQAHQIHLVHLVRQVHLVHVLKKSSKLISAILNNFIKKKRLFYDTLHFYILATMQFFPDLKSI